MATKVPSTRTKLRNDSVRQWEIPGYDEPFVQDPLNFFEKNEFLALVARALEDSFVGAADMDVLLGLLGMEEKQLRDLAAGKLTGDYSFIAGSLFNIITRLITVAPRMLEDLYLLALSVPVEQREPFRANLRRIDDETGFGILETFVEQNTTTIRDFFPRWRELLGTMVQQLQTQEEPDSSATSTD